MRYLLTLCLLLLSFLPAGAQNITEQIATTEERLRLTEQRIAETQSELHSLVPLRDSLAAVLDSLRKVPTRRVVRVPDSIDATGKADVTADLLAFFKTVPDTSTIVFPDSAVYRVEGTLLLENRHSLTFDGNGTTIRVTNPWPYGTEFFIAENGDTVKVDGIPVWTRLPRQNRTRNHWELRGGTDIEIREFIIDGPQIHHAYYAPLEGQHALEANGTRGVRFLNNVVFDIYGDFFRGGGLGGWAEDVLIKGNLFERNGRQAFGLVAVRDIEITENTVNDTRRSLIDIEPNGDRGGVQRLRAHNNVFGRINGHFLALHGKVGTIEDIDVSYNEVGDGMRISSNNFGNRRRNVTIVGNRSTSIVGSPVPLFTLWGIDGLVVRDNYQRMNARRQMTGVYVRDSTDWDIGGNEFPGALYEYVVEVNGATVASAPGPSAN